MDGIYTSWFNVKTATTTAYGGNTKATTTSKANAGGGGGGAGATATDTGAGAGATSGTDITTSGTINGTPVAAIAGGVGGAVIFIIFLLFIGCKYLRKQKREKAAAIANGFDSPPPPFSSEVELPTNQARRKPAPKKPNPSAFTTPVSPVDHTEVAELGEAPTRFERMRRAVVKPRRKDPPAVEMPATNPNQGRDGQWFEMHVP